MDFKLIFITILVSYFLGSLNFSIIISKYFLKRNDIRNMGSNNAGFSNALRSLGFLPALFTFAGDFLKGVFAICIAKNLRIKCEIEDNLEFIYLIVVAFFCCIGHMWPCFFKFKGGKGILTAWACSLLIDWRIFVCLISIFILVLAISKIISLSSIISASINPILVLIFSNSTKLINYMSFGVSFILSVIIVIKHWQNIIRIISGKENKIKIKRQNS